MPCREKPLTSPLLTRYTTVSKETYYSVKRDLLHALTHQVHDQSGHFRTRKKKRKMLPSSAFPCSTINLVFTQKRGFIYLFILFYLPGEQVHRTELAFPHTNCSRRVRADPKLCVVNCLRLHMARTCCGVEAPDIDRGMRTH